VQECRPEAKARPVRAVKRAPVRYAQRAPGVTTVMHYGARPATYTIAYVR
jgi:hypothetical protein